MRQWNVLNVLCFAAWGGVPRAVYNKLHKMQKIRFKLCFANVLCNCVWQISEFLTVVKVQEVLTVLKAKEVLTVVTTQEVLTVVTAQELLADVKPKKS